MLSTSKRKILIVLSVLFLALDCSFAGAEEKKGSGRIEDNSFLLEEAYNQEAGVIQHINAFFHNSKTKAWYYTFTEEWPVPDDTHQLSFTLPVQKMAEPDDTTGVGDLALNYRYQLMRTETIAMSPRFSILTPTGDYKRGLGKGNVGFQVNIPISVTLNDSFVTHWNLGSTYYPNAKEASGATAQTVCFNYGASFIWGGTRKFNLMLEMAGSTDEAVLPDGKTERSDSFFVNPGIRFAIDLPSGLQIVPGIAFPIGVGPSGGEYGAFLYLSFEHSAF
jgi:hypothetical protein